MWSPERVAAKCFETEAVILSVSEAEALTGAGGGEADLCEAPEDSEIW